MPRDSFTEIVEKITVASRLGDVFQCVWNIQKNGSYTVGCLLRSRLLCVMKIIASTFVFFTRLETRTKEFNISVNSSRSNRWCEMKVMVVYTATLNKCISGLTHVLKPERM